MSVICPITKSRDHGSLGVSVAWRGERKLCPDGEQTVGQDSLSLHVFLHESFFAFLRSLPPIFFFSFIKQSTPPAKPAMFVLSL